MIRESWFRRRDGIFPLKLHAEKRSTQEREYLVIAPKGYFRNPSLTGPLASSWPHMSPFQTPTAVAAVIPAYNAAQQIGDLVRRTQAILPQVLVVDDGSHDTTSQETQQAGAQLITFPTNHGKGYVLRTAFETLFQQGFSAVVTLDADGQHLPEEIPVLLKAWQDGADLVLGSRAQLFAELPLLRRAGNWLSAKLVSGLIGQRLPDVQTRFRLYTHKVITITGFPEPRFEAESAIVVRAVRHHFRVVSVPIRLGQADGTSTSHYRRWQDTLRIGVAIARTRLEKSS